MAVISNGKTCLPIVLHADHRPAGLFGLVIERLRERAEFHVRQSQRRAVGVFARRVIVQHQQLEPRAAAGLRVFQHLLVAGGIAERHDGTTADVLVDGNGLAGLVVIEIHFRQAHQHGLAVAHFILRRDAAADDLFRRNTVNFFRPRAHELDAAAGHDEGLEPVRAQVGEHIEHRLINHFGVELARLGMSRGGDPVLDDLFKILGGHARVRGHEEFENRLITAGERAFCSRPSAARRTAPWSAIRDAAARHFTWSKAKNACTGSGCSHQSVPSLSNVAMRSGTGTKSGEPGVVTLVTKSMMDCLAAPSFHEGNGSAAGEGGGESHRSNECDGDEVLPVCDFHGCGFYLSGPGSSCSLRAGWS